MQTYDLVVIGSGSGLDVAVACAEHGLRVAVVEKGKMGGTCLNRGCIPSKLLIHSADVVETINRARLFGVTAKVTKIDFSSIIKRVNKIVDDDSKAIEDSYRDINNPKLYKGAAKFIGPKTLQIGKETIKAERFVLAHGARPTIPPIPGLDGVNYVTSTEALRLKKQPRTLTIIGGGYIAAELAHFYGTLGTKINIIQHNKLLVPREDEEVAAKLTGTMSKKYNVYTEYETERVWKKGKTFNVEIKSGKTTKILKSDQLLIAVGVTPNSDLLNVAKTGVNVNKKGHVTINDFMETNVKGVFSLGDAAGNFLFKHTANYEAEHVVHNILNPTKMRAVDYTAMPHAIFTSPQIAGVGATEQELRKQGTKYRVAKYEYINTAMGTALQDTEGFVKFLVDENNKILGCHIIGTDAATLIHEVLVAMRSGDGTLASIYKTVHIHPALSEVVDRAASS